MVTSSHVTTTQSSVTYDETSDNSASESDLDEGSTIGSYTPPRTPTNSLASVEIDPSYTDSTWQQDEQTGYQRQTQLASVVEEDEELMGEMEAESMKSSSEDGLADARFQENVTTAGVLGTSDVKIRSASSGRSMQSDSIFDHPELEESLNQAGPSTLWQGTTGIESTAANSIDVDNKLDMTDDLWSSRVEFLHVLEQESQVDRDKRILEQLGYSEVLGRDYGFWASFSVGYCAFGGLQAAALNMYVTWLYGGTQ